MFIDEHWKQMKRNFKHDVFLNRLRKKTNTTGSCEPYANQPGSQVTRDRGLEIQKEAPDASYSVIHHLFFWVGSNR